MNDFRFVHISTQSHLQLFIVSTTDFIKIDFNRKQENSNN